MYPFSHVAREEDMINDHVHDRLSPTPLASGLVAVVGGGIAGLVAAARIAQRGVPVTLVEKTSHVGGRAVTKIERIGTDEIGVITMERSLK